MAEREPSAARGQTIIHSQDAIASLLQGFVMALDLPPVPVRQWVISVPKRLRSFLADRAAADTALTRIFIEEIERLLIAAAGVTSDASAPAAARPRLGAISFLHRFGRRAVTALALKNVGKRGDAATGG